VTGVPEIGPAPVLSVLVGIFHTGLYLFLRGSAGYRLPFVAVAAVLGAFAGQALAVRLGDPLPIGDFGVIWSSLLAWLGIVLIVAASIVSSPRSGRAR
jgi:biotin transporter BioY